jgi:hypothetical protein
MVALVDVPVAIGEVKLGVKAGVMGVVGVFELIELVEAAR